MKDSTAVRIDLPLLEEIEIWRAKKLQEGIFVSTTKAVNMFLEEGLATLRKEKTHAEVPPK